MRIFNKNIFSSPFKISRRELKLTLTQFPGFTQKIFFPIRSTDVSGRTDQCSLNKDQLK